MPRTNHLEVTGLGDPLLSSHFDMLIPQVPGVDGYDAQNFKTRIMSTSIPGRTIEPVLIDLHGVSKEVAGRMQYSRIMPFEVMETRDLRARDVLLGWHTYIRDNNSNGAHYEEYTTQVQIQLYNAHDDLIRTIRLNEAWLESFDDSQLDGGSSQQVQISGTIKYFTYDDI